MTGQNKKGQKPTKFGAATSHQNIKKNITRLKKWATEKGA